jgi:O-antigen/teichoic acid export membrane protein
VAGYLMPETLLTTGGLQSSILIVGKIVGLAGVGAIRAAQVLLGPLLIMSTATMTFCIPEISRRKDLAPKLLWRIGAGLSVVQVLLTLAYVGVLLLLPDEVGRFLFRDSWNGASEVLLPMAAFFAAASACLGPAVVIIARGYARRTLLLTLMEAPLFLTLMPIGAYLGGAPGAAWGQFIAQVVEVPFWLWQLHKVAHLPPAEGDQEPDLVAEEVAEQEFGGDPTALPR